MPARPALRELRGGRIRSLPTIAIVASLQRQQSVTETLGRSPTTGVLNMASSEEPPSSATAGLPPGFRERLNMYSLMIGSVRVAPIAWQRCACGSTFVSLRC